jgi:hypothetical protein
MHVFAVNLKLLGNKLCVYFIRIFYALLKLKLSNFLLTQYAASWLSG